MQTIEYRDMDKSKWKPGPWINEPDKIQWLDEQTGLPCLIVRGNGHGALCGYVGVPKDHPAYEKDYDAVDVSVHWGLTYSAKCNGDICHVVDENESDDVWWLGFDCAHYKDVTPATLHIVPSFGDGTYKGIDFVRCECQGLAKQLHAQSTV